MAIIRTDNVETRWQSQHYNKARGGDHMSGNHDKRPSQSKLGMFLKGSAALGALASITSPLMAQNGPAFVPVENRPRPEYQSRPITVGAFEISPTIDSQVEYIDNLFPAASNEVEDVIVRVTPSLNIRDRREDRQIQLRIRGGYETFLNGNIDDRLLLNAGGTARFRIGSPTRPFLAFNVSRNDTRGRDFANFEETVQPITVTAYRATAGFDQDVNNFTVTAEGTYSGASYDGEIAILGDVFDSNIRDFEQYGARARVAYTRDRTQTFYVEGQFNEYDFVAPGSSPNLPPNFTIDRSSTESRLSAGVTRNLTEILQLDVSLGYLRQDFKDPALDNVSTYSVNGRLLWNPTRLTSVEARARRTVDTSADPLFAGLLRTEGAFVVQHELRRNIVVGVEGQVASIELIDANDTGSEISFGAMLRYFASRRISVRLRAETFDRTGLFPGGQNRVTVATQLNF